MTTTNNKPYVKVADLEVGEIYSMEVVDSIDYVAADDNRNDLKIGKFYAYVVSKHDNINYDDKLIQMVKLRIFPLLNTMKSNEMKESMLACLNSFIADSDVAVNNGVITAPININDDYVNKSEWQDYVVTDGDESTLDELLESGYEGGILFKISNINGYRKFINKKFNNVLTKSNKPLGEDTVREIIDYIFPPNPIGGKTKKQNKRRRPKKSKKYVH